MKVKIIEKTHELDLEDEINDFLEKKILKFYRCIIKWQ